MAMKRMMDWYLMMVKKREWKNLMTMMRRATKNLMTRTVTTMVPMRTVIIRLSCNKLRPLLLLTVFIHLVLA